MMHLPQEDVQEFSVAVQIKMIAHDLRCLDILNLHFLKCQFCKLRFFFIFSEYFYLIKNLQTTNALTFLKHIILAIVGVS